MKTCFLLFASLIVIQCTLRAQKKAEDEIRRLEKLELATVQKGDTTALLKIWHKDFVVNNPYGEIVTVPQIFGFFRSGKLDYSTVERIVQRVTFIQNVAVCMGNEIVTPQNATEHAGKKTTRQYTNIWLKIKEGWRLIARQATIVSVQ